jgi:hypothetical protein
MKIRVEKISAVTFRVANMTESVRFYRDVLGMEVVYGGEGAYFTSLRAEDAKAPILNLEQGRSVTGWGRMIFYVADVDVMLGARGELKKEAAEIASEAFFVNGVNSSFIAPYSAIAPIVWLVNTFQLPLSSRCANVPSVPSTDAG